ncbi:MAG: trypsin-like peptidase domain-containing protein [Verrucomicrobiota bacterium JB023]|nr:trypsin-like peptidase domain-containing protein [Verrucomicrobiota bacterium JB023]
MGKSLDFAEMPLGDTLVRFTPNSEEKSMKERIGRFLILLVVFCAAFGGVTIWRVWRDSQGLPGFLRSNERDLVEQGTAAFRPEDYTLPELPAVDLEDVALLNRLNAEYIRLVGGVIPSVVSIDTVGERRERMAYYGRIYERRWQTTGVGSGVIVTPEGHVVTNEHVIDGTLGIKVTLNDGRTYPARLIGQDSALDVAVLRIEGDGPFEPLTFGDSEVVQPGEMVFAIGNPFGLGETVTRGIISAKERSISDRQRDLFQTDAAINPGNSGGPLVNLQGEIIGINVAIYSPDTENRGFSGVGFSIPSNDVREVFQQILERGRPVRGFLGLSGQDLNQRVRFGLGYDGSNGVAIETVVPGSPAEEAGLRKNDVVISYEDESVTSLAQLISMIQRTRVNEEVEVGVWRRGEKHRLTAKVTDAEEWEKDAEERARNTPLADEREVLERVGLKVRNLTVLERMRGAQGVLAVEVAESGLAAGAGVQVGDLLLSVNGQRTMEASDLLARIVASVLVQDTRLGFSRQGTAMEATLPKVNMK